MNDHVVSHPDPARWPQILDLLKANGLPEAGLSDHAEGIRIVSDATGLLGCVAIEKHGQFALLRSLAVASAHRGTGLGRQLVRAALDLAVSEEIPEVYLLTETAAGFFARLG